MALSELRYFSPALQKMTAAMVIIPSGPGITGPFPVFYLLHGLSDDYSAWLRQTSIETYLDSIGIAHEYQEFPGAHTWDYWDRHVQEAIAFGARAIGLPKEP